MNKASQVSISFKINRITWLFAAVSLLLISCSVVGQLAKYNLGWDTDISEWLTLKFFLGFEGNFPTYFTSFLCVFSAFLFLLIALVENKRKAPHVLKWAILAAGFLYISVDEIVMIHEVFIEPISNLLNRESLGLLTFAWVIPAMILILFLAIIFFRFLKELHPATRFFLLVAASFYVGGALGMELVGGRYYELHGADNLTYRMMQNIEESMEIIGLNILIWGLLRYVSEHIGAVRLNFMADSPVTLKEKVTTLHTKAAGEV